MDKHVEVMIESRGFETGPVAAQMFGNAGREHMEMYGNNTYCAAVNIESHSAGSQLSMSIYLGSFWLVIS